MLSVIHICTYTHISLLKYQVEHFLSALVVIKVYDFLLFFRQENVMKMTFTIFLLLLLFLLHFFITSENMRQKTIITYIWYNFFLSYKTQEYKFLCMTDYCCVEFNLNIYNKIVISFVVARTCSVLCFFNPRKMSAHQINNPMNNFVLAHIEDKWANMPVMASVMCAKLWQLSKWPCKQFDS